MRARVACVTARAGHPPPAILRPDGKVSVPDFPAGPPLGLATLPYESDHTVSGSSGLPCAIPIGSPSEVRAKTARKVRLRACTEKRRKAAATSSAVSLYGGSANASA